MISIFSVFILNLDLPRAPLVAVLLVAVKVDQPGKLRQDAADDTFRWTFFSWGNRSLLSLKAFPHSQQTWLVEYSHLSQLYLQVLVGDLNLYLPRAPLVAVLLVAVKVDKQGRQGREGNPPYVRICNRIAHKKNILRHHVRHHVHTWCAIVI